jgi:hypothetical protein
VLDVPPKLTREQVFDVICALTPNQMRWRLALVYHSVQFAAAAGDTGITQDAADELCAMIVDDSGPPPGVDWLPPDD